MPTTADQVIEDIYDKTNGSPDCGLCIFITSFASFLWMLVKL